MERLTTAQCGSPAFPPATRLHHTSPWLPFPFSRVHVSGGVTYGILPLGTRIRYNQAFMRLHRWQPHLPHSEPPDGFRRAGHCSHWTPLVPWDPPWEEERPLEGHWGDVWTFCSHQRVGFQELHHEN